MTFILKPGQLNIADLRLLLNESTTLTLDPTCYEAIDASTKTISKIVAQGKIVYGVNTGFGALAHTKIDSIQLETLQKSIVLSHAAGTGPALSDETVRLILALKINSLAEGVETKVQLDFLKSKGCNFVQGYYYSKPLETQAFTQLLLQHQDMILA